MEEKILLYSALEPAEQRDVEHYVQAHPELATMLEDAKAFERLLREARLLEADQPGDDALAYYAVTHRLGGHPAPAWLQDAFDRIEARLQADPALAARYEHLARRIAELEAGHDAVEQFERLTGHRLPPSAPASLPVAAVRPPARRPLRLLRARRWIVAAAVALVAFFGALWLAGRLAVPPSHRLAALDPADFEAGDLRLRSAGPLLATPSADDRYRQAVALLRQARTATLGLFPRYDAARLAEAAVLLEGVAGQEAEGAPLQLEAYYLLGKVRLLQQDRAGAEAALRQVVERADWRAAEAAALLEKMDALPGQ